MPSRPSNRLEAGQQSPRGRTDAAVPERLLPAAPASANGSWPVTERMLRPGCRDRVSRSSRGRSRPPEAGAALPRQELGRRPPSRGRSRAAAAAATAGRAQLPQRFPGQRPPEPSVSRERLLPFGGAVPAIRAGGCHENAGQLPPREGGCCAATEAVAARQQDSIRLGRPVAAREPGSSRPHYSRVLHHACADASYDVARHHNMFDISAGVRPQRRTVHHTRPRPGRASTSLSKSHAANLPRRCLYFSVAHFR